MADEEKEKLIEAVKTIKSFCDSRRCKQCPFSSNKDNVCDLNQHTPYEWDIVKIFAR